MSKKIFKNIKLQIMAGKANPAPPIGPALGQAQVNIPLFCSQFNEATKDKIGYMIPVVISVYTDKSFSFVIKTPPASDLLKKAAKVEKGSSDSIKNKIATLNYEQIKEIAKIKMPDLNSYSLEDACKIIEGTARNMGIIIEK
ncbi:MAG: 50S ribosomal protein L11 [Candidatus Phytoplasma cynodontis]|uniref:50S ribosomal protein L11 n=1 Tax='Cynodon dactylon' phytoplasma TaxID=295320 RepID=UPI001265B301|nr:50S ribosomal protein L11 ['Cynodon dactylon' phytoplasma]KAB8122000.1 50S ribosomal protein L11 ['Cynodon dactylon' phytoplasma]WIA07583.1 MAG: 50S ribosomal protein L11 [Candidatus Phytoplasma cynodontis]